MGTSRRLGSKTCPSFGNWFRNKGFHARETKAGQWHLAAPAGGIFCQAWAACWGTDLPGMGPALQDSEPAGSCTGTPRTKATDPIKSALRAWGRGLDEGGDSGENSLREVGEGTPGKGAALAEARQRVAAGDMGSSRRRESRISSCVTPSADKILLNSRQGQCQGCCDGGFLLDRALSQHFPASSHFAFQKP